MRNLHEVDQFDVGDRVRSEFERDCYPAIRALDSQEVPTSMLKTWFRVGSQCRRVTKAHSAACCQLHRVTDNSDDPDVVFMGLRMGADIASCS